METKFTQRIEELKKGCGIIKDIEELSDGVTMRHYCIENYLCQTCQATLKGIKLQMEDEIGFLNYLLEYPELLREKAKERILKLKQEIKDDN